MTQEIEVSAGETGRKRERGLVERGAGDLLDSWRERLSPVQEKQKRGGGGDGGTAPGQHRGAGKRFACVL